jgi:hypothetical protein
MDSHKSEVLSKIKAMSGRKEIEEAMNQEENTTVRIWMWQYLQTL